jgi:hypothetical protein
VVIALKGDKPWRRLFSMFIFLQLLDILTTQWGLGIGAYEANPFMVEAVSAWDRGVIIKAVGTFAVLSACSAIYIKRPRIGLGALMGLTLFMGWVVAHNLRIVKLLGGF